MPPRGNYRVRLSVQATADIEDILHYTYQQYGQKQEEKYYKIICDALDLIENTPLVGHKRTDLSTQHRSLNAGEHVIVYQVIEKEVFISRILHGRMDFDQRLSQDLP